MITLGNLREEKFYFTYNVPYSGYGIVVILGHEYFAAEVKGDHVIDMVSDKNLGEGNLFHEEFPFEKGLVDNLNTNVFGTHSSFIKNKNGLTLEDYFYYLNPSAGVMAVLDKYINICNPVHLSFLEKIKYINS